MIKKFESFSKQYTVGYDLDGVVNNFTQGFNDVYHKKFPKYEYVPEDQITDWNWFKKLNYNGIDPWVWLSKHKAETWLYSKPYDGAAETIRNMHKFTKENNIILKVITQQPTEESKKEALKWLDRNGFIYDDIVFTTRSVDKWKNADVHLDDSPRVLDVKPDGKISIKMNQLYNKMSDADFEIDDIREFTPELIMKIIQQKI